MESQNQSALSHALASALRRNRIELHPAYEVSLTDRAAEARPIDDST
jgi:hypothetical protein